MTSRRPDLPARDTTSRRPAPARGRCPTCGRADAVLFYPVRAPRPGEPDRPVCLACSPPPDDETKS